MSQKGGDLQFTDELPVTNDSLCVNLVPNFNQNRFGDTQFTLSKFFENT
jgi:hypothetical protein